MTRRVQIDKDLIVRAPTQKEAKALLDAVIGEGDGWLTVNGQMVIEVTGVAAAKPVKGKAK